MIGCYTSPYLPASFKLIPFKAIEATSTHGRRGAEGEFPFGEATGYADLGRKIRVYTLTARFDDNDHVLRAAALIAVCELVGPGPLVHPTRGVILSAACRSITVRDNMDDSIGVTEVDLEFVEANNWPNGLSLVGQLLGLVLSVILNPSRASFRERYVPTNAQSFRRDAVVSAAQSQIANIQAEFEFATAANDEDDARNRIVADLTRLSLDDGMAGNTATVDKGIALGLKAVALNRTGVFKFRAMRRIANKAAAQSTFMEPAATVENAIYSNVRVICAAYMTEGVLESTGQRTSDIFAQLDVIDAILVQEMAYARAICDNALYIALAEFRSSASAKLYDFAYNAPGLVSYNFGGGVHPVVAAYSIFKDAKRHRELEKINNVNSSGRFNPVVLAERAVT
jgi:hypothetical protein